MAMGKKSAIKIEFKFRLIDYIYDKIFSAKSVESRLKSYFGPSVVAVKSFYSMSLEKKEQPLLVKLFYQKYSTLSTALESYRPLKRLLKRPLSRQALKKMMPVEETGQLGVLQGRERKTFQIKLMKISVLP